MKLFKNYNTLSDYNSDKISIAPDNLTYMQNGSSHPATSLEGITAYNTICFISGQGMIKKNDVDYTPDTKALLDEIKALSDVVNALDSQNGTTYIERTKGATSYTSAELNNLYTDAGIGKVVVDVTNSIRYEKFKDNDWFYYYFGS